MLSARTILVIYYQVPMWSNSMSYGVTKKFLSLDQHFGLSCVAFFQLAPFKFTVLRYDLCNHFSSHPYFNYFDATLPL
jgi:hypothetical protein